MAYSSAPPPLRAACIRSRLPFGLVFLLLLFGLKAPGSTNLSAWSYPASSGRLISQPDALGNRIIDFSGVGYGGGSAPLPGSNVVPVRVTVSPVAGDNVANLQSAINQVAALPLDTNGFRGAVLLSAGEYLLASTVNISASGIVLRGVGSSTNGTGTVLRATATNQYTLFAFKGSGSPSTVSGTTHNITNQYVPVGARSFYVDTTGGLAIGDEVFVRRVATSNWIHDLGMDLLGPAPDVPWTPSGYNIDMDRVITHIEGNRVFIDAPITCAIDRNYTNGTIRKFTWNGRIQNVGIEHVYAKSDYFGSNTNETHAWTFVQFDNVVNGWARDLTSQYFGYACVSLNSGDKYVTVQDSRCLDPISIITGGRRYAFVMNDVQYCLVKNCYTRQDRHQFVTQSLTIGPNVFVDGLSDNAHAEAGPHQRWATAILWDNITVHGGNLDVQNAGNYGTGHGWEGANCVVWNSAANGFIVQNPPGARNWLIGSVGPIQNGTAYVGPHAPGTYESSGTNGVNVFPDSLYFAQLQDRLALPNLQTRDYWLGDLDAFTNSAADVVTVDATWRSAVQAVAGGQSLDAFDVTATNHWVPFTFNFSLNTTERVVAATLAVSMLASNSAAADILYLGSLTNSASFTSLGWLPIATTFTNPSVRVLDLTSQLSLLTNGQLNVAVQGDIGIDWAMLELQVAPYNNAAPTSLAPAADATVRGGTYANANYGTTPTLTVRLDSSASNQQQCYLRWDLSSVTGRVYQARIRLTPVNVGTNGIEQGVSVSAGDNWAETGINWNNQPGAGERFATWIPGAGSPFTFDVTPQVVDALAGDRQLSVAVFSLRNLGSAGTVDYAAREYTDPNGRPQLLLWLLGSPPFISGLTNITIPVNGSTGALPFTVGDADSAAAALVVQASSSNPALAPGSNILLGGSGSNRTVTITPLPNQSGLAVITLVVTDPGGLSASTSFTVTVENHPPGVFIWNGPGAGLNNWSPAGNWAPAGPPDAFDDVKFYDSGAAGVSVSNINNVANASFGGIVGSLQYGNTNGNHTTLIPSGASLMLSGGNGLVAGTETDNGTAQTVFATITGPGGSLVLNNSGADIVVRQGTANSGGTQRATLDLSGLGTFTATANQILVGCVGPVNRATGTLFLAKTNTLTLSGSPAICAADNNSNNGGQNFIYLGQTNALFLDSLTIARQKGTATMKFGPGLSNPTAYFRAADGQSRISAWNIADNSAQSTSSSSCNGTNDFTGGTIDALVDNLVLGKSQKTTGANSAGVLTFTAGTIDVNTLQVGYQAQSGATSVGVGRVNVNGAQALLSVNNTLELGHTSGGAGTTNTYGVLSINGGMVLANTITAGASAGTNILSVNGGTLCLTNTAGTPEVPISLVTLTNATLGLCVSAGLTNIVAGTLATSGAGNTIAILALPAIDVFPARFPLIAYTSLGGAGYNFSLAGLPAGAFCGGYVSNNPGARTIDLVITNCGIPDPFLTWNGTFDGDWDTETPNWKNNLGAGLIYAESQSVLFDDTATGPTTINLTDVHTPAMVIVNNLAKPYAFVGPGQVSGSATLVKAGAGTLVIATSNDFTGGTTISAGTIALTNGGAIVSDIALAAGATLDVTARVDGAFTVGSGEALSGAGTLMGDLLVGPGATLNPGPGIGRLTVSGAVTLQGVTGMELDKAHATNDSLVAQSILFGGTLSMTNLNSALAAGDSFKLFSATGNAGAFEHLLPPTPGVGLAWDAAQLLTNGTIGVCLAPASTPRFTSITLNGASLALNGAAGTPWANFYMLAATNVAQPLVNWTLVLTNNFDGYGQFSLTMQMDPASPQQFFRLQQAR